MNVIKKLAVSGAAAGFFLTSAVGTFAAPANFGGNGNAWTNDLPGHYVNNNNPDNRKDWTCHRFAVPGNGGVNANPNSAVVNWSIDGDTSDGGETLVVPKDNLTTCP